MSDHDYVAAAITRGATTLSLDHGSVTVADHPAGVRLTVRTGYAFASVVLTPHQREVLAAMLTPPPYVTPGHPTRATAGFDCHCGECLAGRTTRGGSS